MFSDFGDSYHIYRACELVFCSFDFSGNLISQIQKQFKESGSVLDKTHVIISPSAPCLKFDKTNSTPAPPPSFVVLSRKPTECVCLCYSYSVGVMVAQSQVMSPRYFSLFSPKFLRKIVEKFLLTIKFCAKNHLLQFFAQQIVQSFAVPKNFCIFLRNILGKFI